jgi:phage-related protein
MQVATSEGGKFFGSAERHANTLSGRIKILQDLISSTGDMIGTAVLPEMVGLLKYITEIGKAGQKAFADTFVAAIKEVIHWIYQIIITFKILQYRIEDMGEALSPIQGLFKALRDVAGDVLIGIMNLVVALAKGFLAISAPISAFLIPLIQALGRIVKKVLTGIGEIIDEISPMFLEWVPIFDAIGKAVGAAFENIMPVLDNVKEAIIAAVTPIKAFLTPIVEALQPLFEKVFGAIGKLFNQTAEDTDGLANIIKGLTPIFSFLGNKVAFFIDIFGTGLSGIIEFIKPFVKYILLIVAAIKAWSIVQGILNAVMSMNPIGAIIIAVIALIALVGLVIKNWDKVKAFFIAFGKKVAEVFTTVVTKIKALFSAVIAWIKTAWSTVSKWFAQLWEGIVSVAMNIWNIFKGWIAEFVEAVKSIWDGITGFFSGLWDGIVNTAMAVWDTLKSWFGELVEGIKSIWSGITGFFSGLWEAIKQGPAEAIEYIKNAFFGLFNSIQEKLFGFIGKIREGWETVKGFFGGIGEGIVNFITGGSSGGGDTGGGGQMQPAYAGGSQAAMAGAVGPTSNYAYTSTGGSSTVNAQTSINVTVPPGTSQEQSEAISRQVSAQFDAKFAGSINSSRANIPSPEVRRH